MIAEGAWQERRVVRSGPSTKSPTSAELVAMQNVVPLLRTRMTSNILNASLFFALFLLLNSFDFVRIAQ